MSVMRDYSVRPSLGNDLVNRLGDAVRENPVSAALIGMGVLWMFMGGSRTSLLGGNGRASLFGSVGDGVSTAGQAAVNATGHAGSAVASAVKSVAGTVADTVTGAASAIGDAVSKTASYGADTAAAAYDSASSAAADAAGSVTSAAKQATDRSAFMGSAVQQAMCHAFERQPLLLGAIGLAVGASLAAALPRTETEAQMMGEAAGRLRDKVGDIGGQVKDLASAAIDEAGAQNLIPRGNGNRNGAGQLL